MKISNKYYVSFKWKGNRIRTVTPATNVTEAKKIERAVKTAFKIGTFGHLEPECLDVVMRTYENKGWALPPEVDHSQPKEERTLIKAIKDYLQADKKHRSERNLYAIDNIVGYFGEHKPLKEIKVADVRAYQRTRSQKVENGTVNREFGVLSGIFRLQLELEKIEMNPCAMVKRLPEKQRDSYLSWEDFNRLLDHSWWLRDILTMMFYTGMRFGEVVNLRWEMYKPERRMMVLPPEATKEGKSANKVHLRSKRIPLRQEVVDMLEARRKGAGENVVRAIGVVFLYEGRYRDHCGTYQGKAIGASMVRKAWSKALKEAGLGGLQMRDLRHTWKTNAQRSGMDPTVRNLIVGHSSNRSVEDRYIRVSDEELLKAVDTMKFDNGWTELDVLAEG